MSSVATGQQSAGLPDASVPTETVAPPTPAADSTAPVQPAAAADGATGAGQLTNNNASDAPAQAAAAGGSSDAASAATATEPAVEQPVAAAQPVA